MAEGLIRVKGLFCGSKVACNHGVSSCLAISETEVTVMPDRGRLAKGEAHTATSNVREQPMPCNNLSVANSNFSRKNSRLDRLAARCDVPYAVPS